MEELLATTRSVGFQLILATPTKAKAVATGAGSN